MAKLSAKILNLFKKQKFILYSILVSSFFSIYSICRNHNLYYDALRQFPLLRKVIKPLMWRGRRCLIKKSKTS